MKRVKKMMTFPESMFLLLKAEAEETGLAVTEILRRAVTFYFENRKP